MSKAFLLWAFVSLLLTTASPQTSAAASKEVTWVPSEDAIKDKNQKVNFTDLQQYSCWATFDRKKYKEEEIRNAALILFGPYSVGENLLIAYEHDYIFATKEELKEAKDFLLGLKVPSVVMERREKVVKDFEFSKTVELLGKLPIEAREKEWSKSAFSSVDKNGTCKTKSNVEWHNCMVRLRKYQSDYDAKSDDIWKSLTLTNECVEEDRD